MGHKRQGTYLQLSATIVAEAGEVLYGPPAGPAGSIATIGVNYQPLRAMCCMCNCH